MHLGETLQTLRKKSSLTQKKLADMLGVSFQTVSKWERNLSYPDVATLPRLADILGVSMDTLFNHVPGELTSTYFYRSYQTEEYYWGTEPTPFCYRILENRPPSRPLSLLEIGCGEGRDAVFFARNGYDVTAYDIVPAGICKTQNLAAMHRVSLQAFCADMQTFQPKQDYDIIYASRSLQYISLQQREEFFNRYKQHTVSGGLNAFMVIVDKPGVPAPPDEEDCVFLMRSGEIFTYYHDWNFLVFEEKIIDCMSSGVPHKHCVNLMLAVKP